MTDDRSKRPPPTIDLEPNPPSEESAWRRWLRSWRAKIGTLSGTPRWNGGLGLPSARGPLLAAVSGALAALALIAILWSAGLVTQRTTVLAPAATDELAARLTRIETRLAAPQAPVADTALTGRVASVEQSLEALRQSSQQMQQALLRQADSVTSALNDIKSAPRQATPAPAVDLGPLNQRIAELEQSIRGLTARRAESEQMDPAIARMAIANSLVAAMGNGQPYATILAAAKQSGGAATLAPLEAFATTGVPDDATLSHELVGLLPQLEPKPTAQPAPSGWVERLEASASRLVRVRPVGDGDDAVQRIAAAARRNDVATARRDFDRLAAAQRAPAEVWIARYDAREAARKASLTFATEALVTLPRR